MSGNYACPKMVSQGTNYLDLPRLKEPEYRQQVFNRLVEDYKDDIYRYCVTRLGSDYGEDTAQEVFVTAWEKLETFRGDGKIGGWLKGIAKNKCKKFFHKRFRRAELMDLWIEDIRNNLYGNEQLSAEDEQVNREKDQARLEKLVACISRLSDQDGLLIRLCYHLTDIPTDIPVKKIGDLFGIEEATVRKRLTRAFQKLIECMKNDG